MSVICPQIVCRVCTHTYAYVNVALVDINECRRGTHKCSHKCKNTAGSYRCKCPIALKLGNDQKTCGEKDAYSAIIILSICTVHPT